ncbi:MAG: NUDIX hydrolase [Bowdeniella nasicola]|nr:NUDIX hydrolase [Bowdeniella nasicola]
MGHAVHAAGAVVWREKKGRIEVLLVHRPRYNDWGWPKGKQEDGELLPATAVREVEEETGRRIRLGRPLPTVRYRLKDGRHKASHYWAATVASGTGDWGRAREPVKPASAKEIDRARWVSATRAAKMLTYPHDREPLFTMLDEYHAGRLRGRAVLVVRHARAKKRSAFTGGEADRPLTKKVGAAQAAGLVPLLSAYGVSEVVTSPWQRCTATLAPYLEATGITPISKRSLTEDAHAERPAKVRRLMTRDVLTGTSNLALCTHRPVLPTVIEALKAHAGEAVAAALPQADPWLQCGETLICHLVTDESGESRVLDVERHRPRGRV